MVLAADPRLGDSTSREPGVESRFFGNVLVEAVKYS